MGDHRSYFHGKKITVLGLGLLGRGIGDVAFLAEWVPSHSSPITRTEGFAVGAHKRQNRREAGFVRL